MGRKKISEEERKARRRVSHKKHNNKRRQANQFIDLDHHPNAFAKLASKKICEKYVRELETGSVVPKLTQSSQRESEIGFDPDDGVWGGDVDDDVHDGK